MLRSLPVGCTCFLLVVGSVAAAPPLYVTRREPDPAFLMVDQIRRNVPKLRHDRGTRWPMIMWSAGSFDPQPPAVYQELLARGLTQHIRMDEAMIPTALALQAAGSPVIMMEGQGGTFPYSVAGDAAEWQHQFDSEYERDPDDVVLACPAMIQGWAANADRIRQTLRRFKEAGVMVNAVWMDWEVEPRAGIGGWEQAVHCARCRATLPKQSLETEQTFRRYCARKNMELVGTYLAAPVAEIFPGCSTTNWRVVTASPLHPSLGWSQTPINPRVPTMFTATNPTAYGMTLFFDYWRPEYRLDREHVDQFYMHFLLRDVSNDTANRRIFAPHLESIPWVVRWCLDTRPGEEKRPIMTRERYREVLRHFWFRGINGMQVFNSILPGFEEMAVLEVEDAVAIYDEALKFRDFLDRGEVMNLTVPKVQDSAVIWSGLRLGNRAVVRTFKQGGGNATISIEPWPKKRLRVTATPAGDTYLVELAANGKVTAVKASR